MIIAARFNGPPGSGNGGYCAGRFADAVAGAHPDGDRAGAGGWEVTLRLPPPLETPLSITGERVLAPDGSVVAQVTPSVEAAPAVPPIGYAEAVDASTRFPGFADHPFPTCYVCGPRRDDGLRIFPGQVPDGGTAAPWRAPADVSPATLWAALDCPGGWSVISPGRPYVLGRIAAVVRRVPEPGERCVVRGALSHSEGRKALVHTTVYGFDGVELARARATWIALPENRRAGQ